MRRVVYSAMFAAIAAATVVVVAEAQQPAANTNKQATLVMKSGERHSGTLVYHNDANFNLIGNGQDRPYRIEDIAVLDFGGGDPTAAELNRLPSADGSASDADRHMLVLRDGTIVHGRMYTITSNAITINTPGGHQNFDLNNVSRLYVNPGTSRRLYGAILNPASPAPAATTVQTVPAGAIQVEANRGWTDTGITVRRGERIAFSTGGQVATRANAPASDMVGPDGSATEPRIGAPVPAMGVGGLIGRIGNGAPFAIGSSTNALTMGANGRLFLGVNDAGTADNSGAFTVTVQTTGRRRQ